MSFNGSGTFVINSAGQPVVANTVISATVFNALTADLATGLTNCITKDGQSTPTANIPMGNNKITGLGAGTAATDAATLGQVQSTAAKLITVTGTDTISGTMSPALTAYAAGQLFYFIANAANTGAMTINIDGLGAKNITRDGSTALVAGDVNSGEIVVICYDGTRFQMINAANSFGNTTINGTLTVTGNTALQANVSVTSALSVGGVFAVTGAATLGSTLAVTGKSDLPTVSTASMNAAVAVVTTGTVTNLTATSASVASMNAGVALLTTATVTTLNATGASIASANIGNLQFTAASIASINAGVAVVTNLTATSASIASANVGTAVVTTGTVTNLTSTSASIASANAAVALVTTGTVTNLTSTAASIASVNLGTAVISSVTLTGASIASVNIGNAVITGASIASMNGAVANITTVNATTVDATNVEVTNVKAKDGTAAITIADSTGNVALSANLTFSSTAQRITGDFSNATFANRLMFQTSTTNANTAVESIPSGTGTATRWTAYNNSDPTNASFLQFGITGTTAAVINSGIRGTGTYVPITFETSGSERMRLDTSGNLGIGTASPGTKLQVTTSANATGHFQSTGNYSYLRLEHTGTGAATWDLYTGVGSSTSTFGIANSGGTRLTIDSSGNVGIGGTAGSNTRLDVLGTAPLVGGIARIFNARATIPTSTAAGIAYGSELNTSASSTITAHYHFYSAQGTIGAGSTITNQYGYFAESNLTGATNNFGFYSNIASGSNRWNLYCAGSADNYMAGDLLIGTTTPNPSGFGITLRGSTPRFTLEPTADTQSCRIQFALTDGTIQTAIRSGGVEGRDFKFVDEVGAVTRLFIEGSTGNIKIGGTTAARSTTAGTNQLVLFNGTAPVGTLTNGVSFYSASGEANVMDAAGNATLLSPHDSETNEWIFRSKHTPTGKVLKIDVEKMLRFINEHFDLDMVQEWTE